MKFGYLLILILITSCTQVVYGPEDFVENNEIIVEAVNDSLVLFSARTKWENKSCTSSDMFHRCDSEDTSGVNYFLGYNSPTKPITKIEEFKNLYLESFPETRHQYLNGNFINNEEYVVFEDIFRSYVSVNIFDFKSSAAISSTIDSIPYPNRIIEDVYRHENPDLVILKYSNYDDVDTTNFLYKYLNISNAKITDISELDYSNILNAPQITYTNKYERSYLKILKNGIGVFHLQISDDMFPTIDNPG
ncbi:MAG: hypothetical protein OCD76_04415 [Reichenbachiella sp.]